MIIELRIPSPGESITEVEVGAWLVDDGSVVEKDQEIAEVESEKATLPIVAEESGKVKFLLEPGSTAKVGDIICTIDTDAVEPAMEKKKEKQDHVAKEASQPLQNQTPDKKEPEPKVSASSPAPEKVKQAGNKIKVTPVAAKKMEEYRLSVDDIIKGLKRITSEDVERARKNLEASPLSPSSSIKKEVTRETSVEKMSQLRKKLSSRLVAVKNETAMLTTFNEVDMSEVIRLRKTWQDKFIKKHGIKLGFMSFFIKASAIALMKFPGINSMIDGGNIITYHYADIGIAVQTDKGLMVPVIRNAGTLSLADIETELKRLADKARKNRISIDDMSGGTFSITNGGVFGSMLSTPLLNPPQAAILGMHNIVERPVAVNEKVEIRPVMYLALSYDHRLVDGRDSVSFLRSIKEMIEQPVSLFLGGASAEEMLLDL